MPYELSFVKKVDYGDTEKYFNECCYGGDVIQDIILPSIKENYQDVQADQEDWGWFIWFKDSSKKISFGVDIFCDDPQNGEYRIHLTSRTKKWMGFSNTAVDVPELDTLCNKVTSLINQWSGGQCKSEKLDANYAPIKQS